MSFALTATEVACGVTVEEVERIAARGYVSEGGQKIALDPVGPALAGAAARLRLGGEVAFLGFNQLDQPVYGRMR